MSHARYAAPICVMALLLPACSRHNAPRQADVTPATPPHASTSCGTCCLPTCTAYSIPPTARAPDHPPDITAPSQPPVDDAPRP